MRRAGKSDFFTSDSEKLSEETVMGFILGGNACTEHECGNQKIREVFGCDPKAAPGIPRRQITNTERIDWRKNHIPLSFYFEDDQYAFFFAGKQYNEKWEHCTSVQQISDSIHDLFCPGKGRQDFQAAWDDESLAIIVPKVQANILRRIKQAFDERDIVFLMVQDFIIPGFVIAIASRLPKEVREKYSKKDLSEEALQAEHLRIGIEEELKQLNASKPKKERCLWFALSPAWISETRKADSQYKVMYWLNPRDQEHNAYGWFTVEQLRQWANGCGPIPGRGRAWQVKQENAYERMNEKKLKQACYEWMVDRLKADGCPSDEATQYDMNEFVSTFYEDNWETFMNDAEEVASRKV